MKFIRSKGLVIIVVLLALIAVLIGSKKDISLNPSFHKDTVAEDSKLQGLEEDLNPLSIEHMRKQDYPGSDLVIEQEIPDKNDYKQYIASYKSEGLKIYALLTIPRGTKPKDGWPVIIFNHGYIPPNQYRTTERYIAYVDAFARNGYIVFKPDYRGHGDSEGKAEGGYGSSAYTIDVLNAVSSIKRLKDPATGLGQVVDPNLIGMWGHSMGGGITLRSMVLSKEIKAGVIWAGVVGSYSDLLNNWRRRNIAQNRPQSSATSWRQKLTDQYGTPEKNPEFWNSISASSYLKDISGPVQLHHAKDDSHVPYIFSEKLNTQLQETSKSVELYTYKGDDHNLTSSFNSAMERSIEFFNKHLKGGDSK